MASVTGFDASGRVDDLAVQEKKQCTAIAIGKPCLHSLAKQSNRRRHPIPPSPTHLAKYLGNSTLGFHVFSITSLLASCGHVVFCVLLLSGSAEGFSLADKAIMSASKGGR